MTIQCVNKSQVLVQLTFLRVRRRGKEARDRMITTCRYKYLHLYVPEHEMKPCPYGCQLLSQENLVHVPAGMARIEHGRGERGGVGGGGGSPVC